MSYRLAGNSLWAFGVASFITTAVGSYFFDALVIDVAAVIVFALSGSVSRASPRAARWSLGFMVLYLALGVLMLFGATFSPERIRIGGRPIRPEEIPWTVGFCAAVAVWSAVNIALLVWALRSSKA